MDSIERFSYNLCGWGRYKSPIANFCSPPSKKQKKGELYLNEMAHLRKLLKRKEVR